MRSDDARKDSGGPLPPPVLKAAGAAGRAVLCAATLAVGAADGAPPGSTHGRAASGSGAGLAAAGGVRGPARTPPLPQISRLCFHGPRGEPVDFAAVQHCP